MNTVTLRSGALYGDRTIELRFPDDWQVQVAEAGEMSALSDDQLRAALQHPIGSPALAELARTRRSAAILIDDIMRPTPTARLLPLIVAELEAAGMPRSAIRIVIASGAHSSATAEDINRKVGERISRELVVVPHHAERDLAFVGRSARGTPVYVNQTVMASELKIGVGGVYPHAIAGFSGGSKILMPGVCGLQTVRYVHDSFEGAGRHGGSLDNAFRHEADAIATMVGLDFVIDVLLTPTRDIAGLFAGDKIAAHRDGVRAASERYRVAVVEDADVIVANTYPFDTSLYFIPRGFWPFAAGKRAASRVAVADGSMGQGHHGFRPPKRHGWTRLTRALAMMQPTERGRQERRVAATMVKKAMTKHQAEFLMFSAGLRPEALAAVFPRAQLFHAWEPLRQTLETRHPRGPVKVAVYPYAPLQLPGGGGPR